MRSGSLPFRWASSAANRRAKKVCHLTLSCHIVMSHCHVALSCHMWHHISIQQTFSCVYIFHSFTHTMRRLWWSTLLKCSLKKQKIQSKNPTVTLCATHLSDLFLLIYFVELFVELFCWFILFVYSFFWISVFILKSFTNPKNQMLALASSTLPMDQLVCFVNEWCCACECVCISRVLMWVCMCGRSVWFREVRCLKFEQWNFGSDWLTLHTQTRLALSLWPLKGQSSMWMW